MTKHLIWATTLVLSVTAIAYSTSQYAIEETKQNAFMMKACLDAGGSWTFGWRPIPYCDRPKHD